MLLGSMAVVKGSNNFLAKLPRAAIDWCGDGEPLALKRGTRLRRERDEAESG